MDKLLVHKLKLPGIHTRGHSAGAETRTFSISIHTCTCVRIGIHTYANNAYMQICMNKNHFLNNCKTTQYTIFVLKELGI